MSSNNTRNANLTHKLIQDYEELNHFLAFHQYQTPIKPMNLAGDIKEGESFVRAYPIQGILKYHGLSNSDLRIAYNSSVSLNNNCAQTLTYLTLNKDLPKDQIILDGYPRDLHANEVQRILQMIKVIRTVTGIHTPVKIISRNIMTATGLPIIGKGLGTSASGGAAIAHAMMDIIYQNNDSLKNNTYLRSVFARYLAGSAARSTVGGIGLWLNHPKMDTWDSYAIRLDRAGDQVFINDIALITIAIPAIIKTDQAHLAAPTSPFFETWLQNRNSQIYRLIEALEKHDISSLGELAEYDTHCLHAVTITATAHSIGHLTTPESLAIMRLTHELRRADIPVYYSLDTGPSVVLITKNQYVSEIQKALMDLLPINLHEAISIGSIGGPSSIIQNKNELPPNMKEDLEKYG